MSGFCPPLCEFSHRPVSALESGSAFCPCTGWDCQGGPVSSPGEGGGPLRAGGPGRPPGVAITPAPRPLGLLPRAAVLAQMTPARLSQTQPGCPPAHSLHRQPAWGWPLPGHPLLWTMAGNAAQAAIQAGPQRPCERRGSCSAPPPGPPPTTEDLGALRLSSGVPTEARLAEGSGAGAGGRHARAHFHGVPAPGSAGLMGKAQGSGLNPEPRGPLCWA